MDKSRREMLKKSAMVLFSSILASGAIKKIQAFSTLHNDSELAPQNKRVVRKALFIEKNCIVAQQAEAIKKKKKIEINQCNACVDVCPVKTIETVEVKNGKGLKMPLLKEDKCIGCGRCLRVCPQTPKAWEIWDKTNNKKLM